MCYRDIKVRKSLLIWLEYETMNIVFAKSKNEINSNTIIGRGVSGSTIFRLAREFGWYRVML
jgi:hypothetical protein